MPPVIVAVVAQKGGVGKSTLSALLALSAAELGRRVLVVDADPQASLALWADEADGLGDRVLVVQLANARLDRELARLGSFDHVVIDTPPGAGDRRITEAALRAADLALVPVTPTFADLAQIRPALDLAAELGTPAVVVLNRARAGTRSTRDAVEALGELDDVPVLSTVVPLSERIAGAFGGRRVPAPLPALWAELEKVDRALKRRRR